MRRNTIIQADEYQAFINRDVFIINTICTGIWNIYWFDKVFYLGGS